MKRFSLVPTLGATFAAALAATACAVPANQDFLVAITDESNSDSQQSAAHITLRSLPNAKVDVRLASAGGASRQFLATRAADGRITGDDRFLECYNFARARGDRVAPRPVRSGFLRYRRGDDADRGTPLSLRRPHE